jgi:hypothetical protein
MTKITRIELDVLKPHRPTILEFAREVALLGEDYRVRLDVEEVDEKTETTKFIIEGESLDFDRIEQTIKAAGGIIHSIDSVEVIGGPDPDQ